MANLTLNGPPIGTPSATPPFVHGLDTTPTPVINNPAAHQIVGNNNNLQRIQNEQNAKNMAMEPKQRVEKDKQLTSIDDFGEITLHFQELRSHIGRKIWNSSMEAWALAQITPKSAAYSAVRTAIHTRYEDPVTRCYFASLEHY